MREGFYTENNSVHFTFTTTNVHTSSLNHRPYTACNASWTIRSSVCCTKACKMSSICRSPYLGLGILPCLIHVDIPSASHPSGKLRCAGGTHNSCQLFISTHGCNSMSTRRPTEASRIRSSSLALLSAVWQPCNSQPTVTYT